MDSSRLRAGEIVAGIAGVALFVFLFFDWFGGGAEVSGSVVNGTATLSHPGISGWDALGGDLSGFLIILSGVAGIALAYLAAAGQRVNIPAPRGATTALLGALAVLLILWDMLAGSPTLKVGVFLGLAAAVAITAGALMALAEDGFQPLVAVAGGRTRAASASAPAATPPPPAAVPAKSSSSSSGSTTTKRATAKKPAARSGSKAKSSSSRSSSTKKKSSSSRTSSSKGSSSSKK